MGEAVVGIARWAMVRPSRTVTTTTQASGRSRRCLGGHASVWAVTQASGRSRRRLGGHAGTWCGIARSSPAGIPAHPSGTTCPGATDGDGPLVASAWDRLHCGGGRASLSRQNRPFCTWTILTGPAFGRRPRVRGPVAPRKGGMVVPDGPQALSHSFAVVARAHHAGHGHERVVGPRGHRRGKEGPENEPRRRSGRRGPGGSPRRDSSTWPGATPRRPSRPFRPGPGSA